MCALASRLETLKNVRSYEAMLFQVVSIYLRWYSIPSVHIHTVKNPLKIIDCVPHWNGTYFNFTLYWTVPEFVAYGSGIFHGFVVIVKENITKQYADRREVPKTPNQTLYSYTWRDLRPLASNLKYQFRVNVRSSLCTYKCSISPLCSMV